MSSRKLSAEAELELIQDEAFSYFLHETNPVNGWPVAAMLAGQFAAVLSITSRALRA
jgi:hypothetical protein